MNFGIDFGTSNSGVVYTAGNAREPIGEGQQPYPSIAAIQLITDEITSGAWVREHQAELTTSGLYRVVTSVKQHLDTPEEWSSHGRRWTPEDIAAEILTKLKRRVYDRTGAVMERATISIPVGFSRGKRAALRRAAAAANIDVRAFISEPTAALLGQLHDLQHCRHAAVFDWGGGTLDISVIEIHGNGRVIHELKTSSLTEAGDDIDRDIAAAVHTAVMDKRGVSKPFEAVAPKDRDLLLTQCEKVKCEFAAPHLDDAPISLISYEGRPLEYRLTRARFNALIDRRVEGAIRLLRRTIEEAPLSIEEIDWLIVTGGSSRLLLLRERLLNAFQSARFSHQPEWDIAFGAAVLDQYPGDYVLAEDLGILLSDGTFHPMLRAGDRPEGARTAVSLALVEDSAHAEIPIVCSNGGGEVEPVLTLVTPTLGFDRERIEVSCGIDADLVLHCKAQSDARGGRGARATYEKLRFTYEIGNHAAAI
jgi:molecular chaperone DnaK